MGWLKRALQTPGEGERHQVFLEEKKERKCGIGGITIRGLEAGQKDATAMGGRACGGCSQGLEEQVGGRKGRSILVCRYQVLIIALREVLEGSKGGSRSLLGQTGVGGKRVGGTCGGVA